LVSTGGGSHEHILIETDWPQVRSAGIERVFLLDQSQSREIGIR
jgi:hypothetical protein